VAVHSRYGRGMRLAFIISLILALLTVASPAEAANRVALVIGNDAYENVPQLQKAVNDADAVAAECPSSALMW
jgi:Skp family chaperone for outer membrane proteins